MPLRVIPVIDLLGGQVVRGVAGRRKQYRPVESILCDGSSPSQVANALVREFSFSEVYVADLEAIGQRGNSWADYRAIAQSGMTLLLDAGIADATTADSIRRQCLAEGVPTRLIVGLETLRSFAELRRIVDVVPRSEVIFSVDLKHGQPLTNSAELSGLPPLEIAERAIEMGVGEMIILDLAAVGVGEGVPTLSLCREITSRHPDISLIAGGGVRGVEDLKAIEAAGCDGALVASALHDGRLSRDGLINLESSP